MNHSSSDTSWKAFLELCLKARSIDELNQLFELFFTIEEKETLTSRFVIVKTLLEEKLTQREISEQHKVSIAQITRGSNALKRIDPQLKKLIKSRIDS